MRKNILLIAAVAIISMGLNASTKQEQTNKITTSLSQQNEVGLVAYAKVGREWVKGYVYLVNGFVTRCRFPDKAQGRLQAKIYQRTKPRRLNPNNPIAAESNFTHYIDIPNYGRTYFSM